jgi:hypothetical protein
LNEFLKGDSAPSSRNDLFGFGSTSLKISRSYGRPAAASEVSRILTGSDAPLNETMTYAIEESVSH